MSAPVDAIAAAPAAAAAAAAPAATVTPAAARAAAREAEILALNAAAKADIEAIGQPQAKDVSPRDIVSPINEALLPSGGSTKVDTPWDGATSTFTIHQRNVTYTVSYDDYALIYDQYYDPDLYDAVYIMYGTFPTLIMYRTSYLSTSSSTRVHYYSSLF